MMDWTLNTVRLFVTDIDRAKAFYCDTLNLPLQADGRPDGFLLFNFGNLSLVVERIDEASEEQRALVGRFAGISFSVPDVNATYAELTAKGVEFMGTPEQKPWGGTAVSLLDPDRNALSLVSGLA